MVQACPKCQGEWVIVEIKLFKNGVLADSEVAVQCPGCRLELVEKRKV